jgi:hypothetical protein
MLGKISCCSADELHPRLPTGILTGFFVEIVKVDIETQETQNNPNSLENKDHSWKTCTI